MKRNRQIRRQIDETPIALLLRIMSINAMGKKHGSQVTDNKYQTYRKSEAILKRRYFKFFQGHHPFGTRIILFIGNDKKLFTKKDKILPVTLKILPMGK